MEWEAGWLSVCEYFLRRRVLMVGVAIRVSSAIEGLVSPSAESRMTSRGRRRRKRVA